MSTLKELLSDWQNLVPAVGLIVLAAISMIFWLRRKPKDPNEIERARRAYLNRIGRIVEGQVLEMVEGANAAAPATGAAPAAGAPLRDKASYKASDAPRSLLYYTYAISGVTYETAQDVTGLEQLVHLNRVASGQTASVKYDPSNPSNSILLADDWSGLH